MREYGQVQCAFWSHPDVQELSDDGKLLALYLLTGPHSNGIGCFRVPDGYVMADLKWAPERVSKGFDELFQTGFSKRCSETDFVLLPKFLGWNPIANPNVAKARAEEAKSVPRKFQYFSDFITSLEQFGNHWADGFIKGLSNGIPNRTLPNPTQPIGGKCPPSVDEVREYFESKGTDIDPEAFHAYYQANGWTQGKGKKIRDWRACLVTWEKRNGHAEPKVNAR